MVFVICTVHHIYVHHIYTLEKHAKHPKRIVFASQKLCLIKLSLDRQQTNQANRQNPVPKQTRKKNTHTTK